MNAAPAMLSTLSGIVTLTRTFLLKAPYPMLVTAVADGHAGEGVIAKRVIPNRRNAIWNNYAGEGVAIESTIFNVRNAA